MKAMTRLRNLEVNEGSLVNRGANKRALVKLHKGDSDEPQEEGLVARIVGAVLKALGRTTEEVEAGTVENHDDSTATPHDDEDDELIQKGSFQEELGERIAQAKIDQVQGEVWDYFAAGERSILSILKSNAANKEALIRGSLDQMTAAITTATPSWLDGNRVVQKVGRKVSAARLERLKAAHASLAAIISEAEGNEEGTEDMPKIEKAQMDMLPKSAQDYIAELEAQVAKGVTPEDKPKDDINKAELSEPVRKRLEELEAKVAKADADNEARKSAEFVAKARELGAVDPEKLGPVLKALSETNPEGYTTMVETLKATSEAVAKSKVFEEVGKSGGNATHGTAYQAVVAKAEEIRKSDRNLTQSQAITKVLSEDKDLAAQYAKERDED